MLLLARGAAVEVGFAAAAGLEARLSFGLLCAAAGTGDEPGFGAWRRVRCGNQERRAELALAVEGACCIEEATILSRERSVVRLQHRQRGTHLL